MAFLLAHRDLRRRFSCRLPASSCQQYAAGGFDIDPDWGSGHSFPVALPQFTQPDLLTALDYLKRAGGAGRSTRSSPGPLAESYSTVLLAGPGNTVSSGTAETLTGENQSGAIPVHSGRRERAPGRNNTTPSLSRISASSSTFSQRQNIRQ